MNRAWLIIFAIIIAVVVIIVLIPGKKSDDDGKLRVTASIFAPYDFVREIAGDKVRLAMLLPPGAESHSFEPTPRDIITVEKSGVFIYTGGEGDAWVARILGSMDTNNMKVLAMMDVVPRLAEEIVEGMEAEVDENGEVEETEVTEVEYDEHVWTSPKNAILIVKAIADILAAADPDNADFYTQNAAAYTESLAKLDKDFSDVVAACRRKTIIVADRFPFRYFAAAYGLRYSAAFPGCATETEPSAATIAFMIDKVKAEKIPVVFHIELSNEKMADTICEATGAKKLLLHACHNVSKKEFEAGASYLEIMRRNVNSLKEALGGEKDSGGNLEKGKK